MPGYTELRDDWVFTETDNGLQGTRAFIEDSASLTDLPDIGDKFDTNPAHSYCTLRNIEARYYHVVGGVNKKKYVLSYSSRGGGGEPAWAYDAEQRNYQGGAEAISIPPPKYQNANWKWLSDSEDIKEVHLFKIVPTGTFTRSIKLIGDSAKNRWFTDKFLVQVGTINEFEFENFRIGSVYFSGCTGGAQYDKYGHRTWVMELQFAWRLIRGFKWDGVNQITQDDWLYLLRPNIKSPPSSWDVPKGADGLYLYEKTDFKDLF